MDVDRARQILDDAHALWAAGELESVLQLYTDDCIYCSTTGGLEGTPLCVESKDAYRTYLRPIMDANETVTSVLDFSYSTGVARARIAIFIRHRQSGHKITATYRQIVTYRGDKMCRIDEYHDVAKLSTFWRLAQSDSMADT